jgi:hypothetical protein
MLKIRVTHPVDPKLNHDCQAMHLHDYEVREVILPTEGKKLAITIRGNNFHADAQPLTASVGEIPVTWPRISPDERTLEGILLQEPKARSFVDVVHGDSDHARHPLPFDPKMIQRI